LKPITNSLSEKEREMTDRREKVREEEKERIVQPVEGRDG